MAPSSREPHAQEPASTSPKPNEHQSRYTREELIAAAHVFGVTPEVVAGALRLGGDPERLTRAEAEALVHRFLTMPV